MECVKIYENGNFNLNYQSLWNQLCNEIYSSNFHGAEYYKDQYSYDLTNHYQIHLLFDQDKLPVAATGVYRHPSWPSQIFRTHSRFWYKTPTITDDIPIHFTGPIHRDLVSSSDALFISFNGWFESSGIDLFLFQHSPLWNDNLTWTKFENVAILGNSGTTILAAETQAGSKVLEQFL